MTSFKQKIASKEIKRADAMKVRLHDLHVEPGFNLRIEDEDFAASIEALALHIKDGGLYPALEVRPRAEGGVFIVDGHRRRLGIHRAIEIGADLTDKEGEVWVPIVAFEGNDADRVARVITSAEGRALKPLEVAEGYKRLRNMGWDNTRIASKVGKTPQHVSQLLLLADANSDVHQAVATGAVSAAVAVGMVREHGENAGKVLAEELGKAKAAGKDKVTAGTIKDKALPPKATDCLVEGVDTFMQALPKDARERLAAIEIGEQNGDLPPGQKVSVPALALLKLLRAHSVVIHARERKALKQREAEAKASQTQLAA
ncbi:hypothetical protein LMG31506_03030 [Cupriavidus yeoncheonensis]|uniref:ParB/Spo0J HTH domain-containing protein n=1 Tax=Cupriavidus yeoncheonensis TaxID=1462994 RepID=A0A916N4R4_9BURK|nr:hypothetical protein [Cupriavidus yeoncheonensis]CAG2144549.1 hypothetical protein LMG31506_03030 [Cupriavidus yeoncheonensis]